jgi:hypothetical protein
MNDVMIASALGDPLFTFLAAVSLVVALYLAGQLCSEQIAKIRNARERERVRSNDWRYE